MVQQAQRTGTGTVPFARSKIIKLTPPELMEDAGTGLDYGTRQFRVRADRSRAGQGSSTRTATGRPVIAGPCAGPPAGKADPIST